MKLTRYQGAAEFLQHARGPLEEQEAANNLIVGIPARVVELPGVFGLHQIYLATVNDGDKLVAAAVRTPPHPLILYSARGADEEPLRLIVDDLQAFMAGEDPTIPAAQLSGVNAHADTARAFAGLWTARTGQPHELAMNMRIYELREVTPPQNARGSLRQARQDELDLLTEWVFWFNVDCHLPEIDKAKARETALRHLDGGSMFLWDVDGAAVAMAARGRNSSHGVTIGMVYTPPELRGRGYASACVAALSQQLLDAGWEFCDLYTDLANPTSNSIYQRIGYRPVCDANVYHFKS